MNVNLNIRIVFERIIIVIMSKTAGSSGH